MKRKIFIHMCILALITILLTSILLSAVIYKKFYDRMKLEVKNETNYIAAALNTGNEDFLDAVSNGSSRITLIAQDGTVLFDSAKEPGSMENHLDRPEVSSALKSGHGEAVRESATIGERTFYYAIRLANGSVIRIASNVGSAFAAVRSAIPFILLIIVVALSLAVMIAREQTRKIVIPINNIDLENPMYNDVYDELAPLLTRMNKQNLLIESQLHELRHKQEELSAITENIQEGLIILDAKTSVLYINRSAIRIFNVKGTDYLHKNVLTLNRSAELRKVVEKAIGGQPAEELLLVGKTAYRILGNPVRTEGAVRGVSILILDVTDKQAAECMRREFTANVSHELKTPLTAISGYAEIMKNGLAKSEDMPRFAAILYDEASRMITLIDDIIKISKLDENSVDFAYEDTDLLAVAREVCERLRSHAGIRGITLSVEGESTVVPAVRQILDEMIYNLCDNAIKYNREGGQVTISVMPHGREAVLTVSDNGIGIPKEHQDRVFERFYRVDKSHSKETGGTGLGLSIVKHGAQFHHAKIELESEPDKGTTIRIIFPW